MTQQEYARLAVITGVFCVRADKHLDKNHFAPRARSLARSLTTGLLVSWKNEAREMGVPEELLSDIDPDLVSLDKYSSLVEVGIKSQADEYQRMDDAKKAISMCRKEGVAGQHMEGASSKPTPAAKPRCDGCHFGRVESVMDTVYKYFFGGAWAYDTGEKKLRQWVECQLEPRIVLKQCDGFCRHHKDSLTK